MYFDIIFSDITGGELVFLLAPVHIQVAMLDEDDTIVVEVISGPGEDSCGVYPVCREEGSWAVPEDCTRS